MSEHANTDPSIHWASVKIIGRENHFLSRKIREAINIHVRRPAMNRNHVIPPPPPPNLRNNFAASSKRGCCY